MIHFRLIREDEARPARPTAVDLTDTVMLGPEQGARRLRRRGLLRALAAEVFAVHPDEIEFERAADGALRIIRPQPHYASLSERGRWTAIAICDRRVGVDVEAMPPEPNLPLELLDASERDEILASAAPERLFLRYWTAREAYLKAQRRGLDTELSAVRASRREDEVVLLETGRPPATACFVEREDAIAAIVELTDAH